MDISSLLQDSLREIGDRTSIKYMRRVSGGDINVAYCVKTSQKTYFAKVNDNIPTRFFQSEVVGLELLRSVHSVSVPEVYLVKEAEDGSFGLLLLEWIDGEEAEKTVEELGRGLAYLHQCYGSHFGLEQDNYIGMIPQQNGLYENWISYFSERRLYPQMILAERKGRMPKQRRAKMEKLLASLDKWLSQDVQPSLLHGDLWSGNWIVGAHGIPYLIDPSVFYGHFEFEIAFTELFGGFPKRFYDAYTEIQPLSANYAERKELYQLFYLLVHLNLFGESYGGAVDRVLRKYVG